MATTRVFRSGNSQAVRIPADLAYDDPSQELTITRMGDVITLAPATGGMREAVALLRGMAAPPTVERIERTEMPDRSGA